TPRLQLRPCALTDVDELCVLWRDPTVRRFLFDDRVLPTDEVRQHVQASIDSFAAHGYGILVGFERPRPAIAGFAGLLPAPTGVPNLIYGIRADLWGRGYATEAAAAVLQHAFTTLRLPRVAADVDEPNEASVRILRKLGMSETARKTVGKQSLVCFEIVAPA